MAEQRPLVLRPDGTLAQLALGDTLPGATGGSTPAFPLPEATASPRTAALGTPANLLGYTNRYALTSATTQPLPPVTDGALVALAVTAGSTASLTLSADGTDKFGDGSSASLVLAPGDYYVARGQVTSGVGRWRRLSAPVYAELDAHDDARSARLVSKGLAWIIDRDYGVIGDGVVDDTAAFQAAVAAAVAGRRALLITTPFVRITSTITVADRGLNIIGPGRARGANIVSEVAGPLLQLGTDNQQTRSDGAITSGQTSLAGSGFTGQAGKFVTVLGAGTAGAPLYTTIASVSSDTSATLALAAATTVSGATYMVNTWEGNTYDGTQSLYVRDVAISTKTASRATSLANGTGNYLAASIGIVDWRGGDINLERVVIEGFDTGFYGVQSDVNHWSQVALLSNHLGAYLGPRSDQFTCLSLYTLFNDRALDLDRVTSHRYYGCQFVGDGTNAINPVRIRSSWSVGSAGVSFDDCWFEHFQGYAAAAVEAFVEIGVGDLVSSNDVHFRNPTIYTAASGSLPRAQYLFKSGRADNISVENPNSVNWRNLDKIGVSVGTTSPSVLLLARNPVTGSVLGVQNNGTGTPSVTVLQWGALGSAGGFTIGGGGITAGAGAFSGRITTGNVTQTLAANGAVTINVNNGNVHVISLQANATSTTIINPPSTGSTHVLTITWVQDATGGRTYAWPSNCKFAGGAGPSDSTATKRTSVTFTYDGTNWNEIGRAVAVG